MPKCSHCGNNCAWDAKTCPKCGNQNPAAAAKFWRFIIVAIVVFVIAAQYG